MSKIEEALQKSRLSSGRNIASYHENKIVEKSDLSLMSKGKHIEDEILHRFKIIYPGMDAQNILQEFRAIRTAAIKQLQDKNTCLMVFSTQPKGGASFTAINIAASIALDSEKTALLLSCDFRNKPDYECLVEDTDKGLFSYLSGQASIDQIIHPVGVERLRIIPSLASKQSFGEYFTTNKFNRLMEEISVRYHDRYIVIDAPSFHDKANVKLLEDFADGVILVVPSGKNSEADIYKAQMLISEDKFIGTVFNNVPKILNK